MKRNEFYLFVWYWLTTPNVALFYQEVGVWLGSVNAKGGANHRLFTGKCNYARIFGFFQSFYFFLRLVGLWTENVVDDDFWDLILFCEQRKFMLKIWLKFVAFGFCSGKYVCYIQIYTIWNCISMIKHADFRRKKLFRFLIVYQIKDWHHENQFRNSFQFALETEIQFLINYITFSHLFERLPHSNDIHFLSLLPVLANNLSPVGWVSKEASCIFAPKSSSPSLVPKTRIFFRFPSYSTSYSTRLFFLFFCFVLFFIISPSRSHEV